MKPRILLFDIENSPNLGWYYDRWEKGNIVLNESNWFLLSFAFKWLGDDAIHVSTLRDCQGYAENKRCDRSLVHQLWTALQAADVIVAHNGDKHDIRKANARFAFHGLPPPSPSRSIDTRKMAKRYFGFESNSLDHLGQHLGLGGKRVTTGFDLHRRAIEGDASAWAELAEYNKRDVELLEQVYLRLRPFMSTHPPLTDYTGEQACPVCQSSNIYHRGYSYMRTGRRRRISCRDCGAWSAMGGIIKRGVDDVEDGEINSQGNGGGALELSRSQEEALWTFPSGIDALKT